MCRHSDRLKAIELKAEQQKRKRRMAAQQSARREQAVNNRRCFEVGKIVCERFPKLRKYQSQYGDAVPDMTYDELVAVVDFLAANRELLDQIKVEALGENSKRPNSK